MDEQKQDNQLEPTHNSSLLIQDASLKTCRKRWTIENGSGKGSGISVLIAQQDDDDDDDDAIHNVYINVYIYIYIIYR